MLIKILRIGTAKVFTVVKLKMEPSDFYNMAMHPFDADGLTSCLGFSINPTALRTAKTLWNFGPSECNRVKRYVSALFDQTYLPLYIEVLLHLQLPPDMTDWLEADFAELGKVTLPDCLD